MAIHCVRQKFAAHEPENISAAPPATECEHILGQCYGCGELLDLPEG